MNLTICLVTRGRSQFLDDCLNSLEGCLKTGIAQVLLIDNGASSEVSSRLKVWCEKNNVARVRFEHNDSRPNRVWDELVKRKIEWVVFPGDDDVFIPSSLFLFETVLSENQNLSAVAFNMNTIDLKGEDRHLILKPSFSSSLPSYLSLANSFHEPQFLWPSLFFRVDHLTASIPTSRFYFDWWVGQQLIMGGNVRTVDEESLKYRVHPLQESNLGDLRRKYFESTYWSLIMINSLEFSSWLRRLDDKDLLEFWRNLIYLKPIYSNESFGGHLLMKIAQIIISQDRADHTLHEIIAELAVNFGVYLKVDEISNLLPFRGMIDKNIQSNVSFLPVEGSCAEILLGTSLFSKADKHVKTFSIACRHSKYTRADLHYDCRKLKNLESDQIADLLILAASDLAVEKGELDFIVSNTERKIISLIRVLKGYLPGFLIIWLKVMTKRKRWQA